MLDARPPFGSPDDAIDVLRLPARMRFALRLRGVRTVGEAKAIPEHELTATPNLGKASLSALTAELERHLGPPSDPPLAACPFCDGGVGVVRRGRRFQTLCTTCGASGPIGDSREASVTGWNRGVARVPRKV